MVDENVVSMVFKKLNLFGNSTHGFDFRKKNRVASGSESFSWIQILFYEKALSNRQKDNGQTKRQEAENLTNRKIEGESL